ncbi:hypothetical protein, partial [Streptomyces sp. MB09-02B]|uniref:hypothetical protein n=1 Tax=Streptomyces sp. MB09-02B TaxID=3028667 RepID=UPI0029BCA663
MVRKRGSARVWLGGAWNLSGQPRVWGDLAPRWLQQAEPRLRQAGTALGLGGLGPPLLVLATGSPTPRLGLAGRWFGPAWQTWFRARRARDLGGAGFRGVAVGAGLRGGRRIHGGSWV